MKNKIFAMLIAFTICFLSSFWLFCGGSSSRVSALEVSQNYYYNIDDSMARSWIDALKNNQSWPSQISRDDFYCCLMFDNSQTTPILKRLIIIDGVHSLTGSNSLYDYIAPTSYYIQSSNLSLSTPSQLENLSLSYYSQSGPGRDIGVIAYDTHYFMTYVNSSYSPEEQSISFPYASITFPSFEVIYVPDGYDLYTGIHFSYETDDFYTWIINNNKLSELPSYIASDKLKSFLSFYKSYGSSAKSFFQYIGDWFSYMNIANQSTDNINVLKSSIDRLYQEYLRYLSSNHAYWPDAYKLEKRNNIDTVTDNDNTNLITDTVNDSDVVLILRDILRGVIAIPNSFYTNSQNIISALNSLDLNNVLVNNGGVTNLSELYEYNINDFNDDFETFEENVSSITAVPLSYVQTINNNSLMPENMLSDKQSLTVTIPVINGFTVNSDGTQYETNTDTYTINSTDYPWLDTVVKKMKRFASIMLIIGYLIHLRFKIADIVRGE